MRRASRRMGVHSTPVGDEGEVSAVSGTHYPI